MSVCTWNKQSAGLFLFTVTLTHKLARTRLLKHSWSEYLFSLLSSSMELVYWLLLYESDLSKIAISFIMVVRGRGDRFSWPVRYVHSRRAEKSGHNGFRWKKRESQGSPLCLLGLMNPLTAGTGAPPVRSGFHQETVLMGCNFRDLPNASSSL